GPPGPRQSCAARRGHGHGRCRAGPVTDQIVLRSVRVDGELVSVRIASGRITNIGADPGADMAIGVGDEAVDGRGGALIPGLPDHHLHLAAMAARDRSLDLRGCDLDCALAEHVAGTGRRDWTRAVGYDDTTHGPLDRWRLDVVAGARPVRVQ